jgi:tRNA dimethylallyltransferase
MNSPRTLHVITGPTAVGKTALALDWAEANGAVIVSCDSLLVYRGMDIGTAKPSPAELARVQHFCVDVADPAGAPYTVGEYILEARRAVDAAVAAGRPVLVTGGSGFYLKSFYAPVMDALEISDAVRAEVAALDAQGPGATLRRLRELEPTPPLWLDLENPRRVTKALERRLASGRSLAELKADFDARPGPFDDFEKKTVVLTRSVESLEARIRRRVEIMLRDGIVDEVKRLVATGLNPESPAAVATGYRETLAWLRDGESGGPAALGESIAIATRQLAAKQRKWFRNQLPDTVRVIDLDAGTPGANTLFS